MPRRESDGAKILRFFNDEPLDKVIFVYDMVRDKVAARKKLEMPGQVKRTRKPKTTAPERVPGLHPPAPLGVA
jgi:hypothetical protein